MQIIYSGGYNNKSEVSIRSSFVYKYHSLITDAAKRGKRAVFVTLAKPDGYYDSLIMRLYGKTVEVIADANLGSAAWSEYDMVFLFGGKSVSLRDGLRKSGFALSKLKKDALILGDSAGAYVLSSYFYNSPPGELRGVEIEFLEGMNESAKVITVAHRNNPVYTTDILLAKVEVFAQEKGLKVLVLNENEQRLLKNGEFGDFEMDSLHTF